MKGQNFLKVCSVILVLAGVFMMVAGGYGTFAKLMDAKEVKTGERQDALSSIQQLDDGMHTLAANQQTYDTGKVAYEEGTQAFAAGQQKLTSGQAEYNAGQVTLANAKKQYNEGKATYEAGKKEYEEGLALYNEKYQEYLAGKATYEAGLQQYNAGKAEIEANTAKYNLGKTLLGSQLVQNALALAKSGGIIPAELQTKIDSAYADIARYEAGVKQLADAEVQLAAGKQQLAEAEPQLADARAKLEAAEKQLTAGKATLSSAETQIAAGENKLNAAAGQLAAGYEQLDDAKGQLADGKQQLQTFEDGEAQVAGGIETLRENARVAELIDSGADPIAAGRQAVDESTEATTKELMSRLYCYFLAIFGGLLAVITGVIGARAADMPSVGKIKASIILGGLTVLVALAANIYSTNIVSKYTINMVTYTQYNTTLQVAAMAILGIGAVLFVVSIIRFKNALIALLTAD